MKYHTDTLARADFQAALPPGVWMTECGERGSRSHGRAFEVRLSGSSPYKQQGDTGYNAATYAEHGVFMARLFDAEPTMKIGHYRDRDDFHRQTRNEFAPREVPSEHSNPALAALRHHVTGAIERGEVEAITEQRA